MSSQLAAATTHLSCPLRLERYAPSRVHMMLLWWSCLWTSQHGCPCRCPSPNLASSPVAPWASPSEASLLSGLLICDMASDWPSGGWDSTHGFLVSTTSSSHVVGLLTRVMRLMPLVVYGSTAQSSWCYGCFFIHAFSHPSTSCYLVSPPMFFWT